MDTSTKRRPRIDADPDVTALRSRKAVMGRYGGDPDDIAETDRAYRAARALAAIRIYAPDLRDDPTRRQAAMDIIRGVSTTP